MFRVLDAYVNYTPTSKLSLALDVNRTTNDPNNTGDTSSPPAPGLVMQALVGVGAYGRYQIAPKFAAGIRYFEQYIIAGGEGSDRCIAPRIEMHLAQRHTQRAATTHRLDAIGRKVHENLMNLRRVSMHRRACSLIPPFTGRPVSRSTGPTAET